MADRDKRRQKKLEKHKKKRQLAAPSGPYWVGGDFRSAEHPPPLLTVVTLRTLADGREIVATALVDRSCLGIKNGFVREVGPGEWANLQERLRESHGGVLEEVDAATALSIVHHAIAYGRRFGFEPHPDFPAGVFPRPEVLVDTAWANSPFPIYISGPDDDVPAILRKLNATAGQGRYHFTPGDMVNLIDQLRELDENEGAQLLLGEGEAVDEDEGDDDKEERLV
ncbi:MAG: hypothetical protein MUF34_32095 [Polyangiaceae bacterium]|nr:hypothetical protein [Polyangiaceae bacterium]